METCPGRNSICSANDTRVFGRDDVLVITTLRKAPLEPLESVFTVAAWMALERLQGRNLHRLLGPLDQRTYSDTLYNTSAVAERIVL
jgi:hypothetical protein